MIDRRSARRALGGLVLIWCGCVLAAHPGGDFPLNDDWSYALAVRHLLDTGQFRPTGWTSMPLVSNAIWGALFSLPAGASFTALHASTIVAALIGIVAVYLLARAAAVSPAWGLLIAATLAFNPIFFALSQTFMTDVLFIALALCAAICFHRSLSTGSIALLLAGTALSVAATLSRQFGLIVPAAFGFACVLRSGATARTAARALMPLVVCVGALLVFSQWLAAANHLPAMYSSHLDEALYGLTHYRRLAAMSVNNLLACVLYLGLFLAPVSAGALAARWPTDRARVARLCVLSSFGVGFAAYVWFGDAAFMPALGNIIVRSGIGPLTLRDTYILHSASPADFPRAFWIVVTASSVVAGGCLLAAAQLAVTTLVERLGVRRYDPSASATAFLLITGAMTLVPLLTAGLTDRYVVPAIPFLAAGLLAAAALDIRIDRRPAHAMALVLLVPIAIFAVCGTRDYLAWNRARWSALADLDVNEHAAATQIDGGLEFNGLRLYDPDYRREPDKSWWWVHDDTYVLAFRPLPASRVLREYHFTRWMPPSTGRILVLKSTPNETAPIGPQ